MVKVEGRDHVTQPNFMSPNRLQDYNQYYQLFELFG